MFSIFTILLFMLFVNLQQDIDNSKIVTLLKHQGQAESNVIELKATFINDVTHREGREIEAFRDHWA